MLFKQHATNIVLIFWSQEIFLRLIKHTVRVLTNESSKFKAGLKAVQRFLVALYEYEVFPVQNKAIVVDLGLNKTDNVNLCIDKQHWLTNWERLQIGYALSERR